MKLEVGDVISFKLTRSSCWGPEGRYKAVVLNESSELVVQYLDIKLIQHRIGILNLNIGFDTIDGFFDCPYLDNVKILKNIATE